MKLWIALIPLFFQLSHPSYVRQMLFIVQALSTPFSLDTSAQPHWPSLGFSTAKLVSTTGPLPLLSLCLEHLPTDLAWLLVIWVLASVSLLQKTLSSHMTGTSLRSLGDATMAFTPACYFLIYPPTTKNRSLVRAEAPPVFFICLQLLE